jgi:UTP--glucose-1-phosphate uridylyltransferase
MQFSKALIPMAGAAHRDLGLQHLTTGAGHTKHAVAIHVEDLLAAGIRQVGLVIHPDAAPLFRDLKVRFGRAVVFIEQPEPLGFGHAVLCAESWVDGEPFVVQVCDHVFISYTGEPCVRQLIDIAVRESCVISAVQAHGERQLPYFGIVGGQRVRGEERLYQVETVIEKPSPTIAEERCMIPGLRQGTYLGFFGIHALTPLIFERLRRCQSAQRGGEPLGLTEALATFGGSEKYLALEVRGQRIDLESPFGMLRAQIALALHGPRREEVLALTLEEVVQAQSMHLRGAQTFNGKASH